MKKISARRQAEWKRKQQQLLLPTSKKKKLLPHLTTRCINRCSKEKWFY